MNLDDLLKAGTGVDSKKETTPVKKDTKAYSGGNLDDLMASTVKDAVLYPQKPTFAQLDAKLSETKKEPSFWQKADLWNTKIGLGIGTGVADIMAGAPKAVSYVKDIGVGFAKDIYTDAKTGNYKDVQHEVAQGIAVTLAGLTKGLKTAKDVVGGAVRGAFDPNKTMGEAVSENTSDDSNFDRGLNYLSNAFSMFAQDEKSKQLTPSKIKDELKEDDGVDYVLKAIGDFYKTYVVEDMQKTIADKKVSMGIDPTPSTADQVFRGLGGLPLWISGGIALKSLATTVGFAEAGASTIAAGSNALIEAGMEANDVYERALETGKSKDEAVTAGLNTFGGNVALIALTNKMDGMFEQNSFTGWKKFATTATAALGEAGQEGIQTMISNANTDRPIMEGVKDSFIVGLIVGAPASVAFGSNPKAHTLDFVPTEQDIQESTTLTPDQKEKLTELVNGELTNDEKQDIVEEVKVEGTLSNKNNEFAQGTPEHEAITNDIHTMLEQGQNPADISITMQNLLDVSPTYADSTVANALATISSKVDQTNAKLDQVVENTKKEDKGYEYIAGKLQAQGVEADTIKDTAKSIAIAISRKGTNQEKEAAITLLSNPANESSRRLYEEETNNTLPATEAESRTFLEKQLDRSEARQYAEQSTQFFLDNAEAGYRVFLPHDATRSEPSVQGVSSTFPKWIPEELRSRKLFDKVKPYLDQGTRPKETKNDFKLARLYDIVQEQTDKFAAEFEANAINTSEQTTEANVDIPFQIAGTQIASESLISRAEALETIRKYFSAEEVPVAFVESIRTPRGIEAWGKYSKQVITLVNNPRADTPHHEAVHAYLDLFVAEEDRQRYLDTAFDEIVERKGKDTVQKELDDIAKRYDGKLSKERVQAVYAEEALADGFFEYLQGRNQKTKLQEFYDMVIAFIKSMRNSGDADRLYEDIIARKRSNHATLAKDRKDVGTVFNGRVFRINEAPLFSSGNRIHEEDRNVMDAFIRHARTGTKLSDADFTATERLAGKWGISMDRPLKTIANTFEKILDDKKRVTGTILYSEKEYAMSHRPTEGIRVNNLEQQGGDIEMPKGFVNELESYFSANDNEYGAATRESIQAVRKLDGKPDDATVTIYRASPEGELNSGDWITLSKTYAELHAKSSGDEKVKVHVYKVPASSVHFAGDDINEFGYYPEEKNKSYLREGQRPLGVERVEKEGEIVDIGEIVARERFDIPNLEKVSFGGSDRDVYALGDKAVLKVVKSARGLTQNVSSTDYYAEDSGLIPKTIEQGKNYVVKERVLSPNSDTKKMVAELKKLDTYIMMRNREQVDQDERAKAYEIMDKYGYSGWDLANYNVLWGDVVAIRNWGTSQEGKPIMLDEGTLNGDLVRGHQTGGNNLSDPEFRDIYNQSRRAKKQFGDTDSKTMYAEKEPASFVRSKTFALIPFQNLSEKVSAFKKATIENTETHAYTLGKKRVKIESAKLQKVQGNKDGVYTDSFAVVIDVAGREQVVFSSEKIENSAKWLSEHAGKSTTIAQNATATLFVDGKVAHVIVTSKDLIPMEIAQIKDTTEVDTINFYTTKGDFIETNPVAEQGAKRELVKQATRDNTVKGAFPSYFALMAGRPVLITDDVSRETEGVIQTEIEQPSQKPIIPNENMAKVRKSSAYERAKERLGEQFQEDVTYTAVKIDDQMAKAFALVDSNPDYAKAVALGLEQPPLDITDTAISIAVAERAKENKDFELEAQIEKARSLRQSRRGQEISLERGRVDENSPEFFIRNLIERRKALAVAKYKPLLAKSKPFLEVLDERVAVAKKKGAKKVKSDLEIKGEELDSFLAEMAC